MERLRKQVKAQRAFLECTELPPKKIISLPSQGSLQHMGTQILNQFREGEDQERARPNAYSLTEG